MITKNLTRLNSNPVIIIAAARSGTKVLREVMAHSSDFIEFPYDMNYVWLYGNYEKGHDQLTKKDLNPKIHNFITSFFNKKRHKNHGKIVLEKTVSNSLRVEFVKTVFPEAKLIHLYRNGLDVAADAFQCWQSSLFSSRIQKKEDLVKKVISYPYLSAYPYLKSYLTNYLSKLILRTPQVKTWGPKYKDMEYDLDRFSLIEICGLQWYNSVKCSLDQLSAFRKEYDYIDVRYESLVTNPSAEISKICNFLAISDRDTVIDFAHQRISSNFVNFHRNNLSQYDKNMLINLIKPCLVKLGYV